MSDRKRKRPNTSRTRTAGLLPGEHRRRSLVRAPVMLERRPGEVESVSLAGSANYIVQLRRLDREWSLRVEWIDLAAQGHVVNLPHLVVERIASMRQAIMEAQRRDAGRRAAEERRAKLRTIDTDMQTA